jgi:hypothetical protein
MGILEKQMLVVRCCGSGVLADFRFRHIYFDLLSILAWLSMFWDGQLKFLVLGKEERGVRTEACSISGLCVHDWEVRGPLRDHP